MDDKVWQIGGLENMTEKIGLRSVTGITNSMIELQGRNYVTILVQLRILSYVHIVAWKCEDLCIHWNIFP